MANQTGQTLDGVIDGLMTIAQTAYGATWDATFGAWVALFDTRQLAVVEGYSDAYQPDAVVMVARDVRQPIERPTMGTSRSRERSAEIDVAFSVFVAGAPGVAIPAARRGCNKLVDAFEDYFRTATHETIAAACRDAWVSKIDGPTPKQSVVDGEVLGYLAEAVVTVTAKIRY